MDDQTTNFGTAAQLAVINAARSLESSTKPSTSLIDHKRMFLETFRRWEILFKRKDGGDVQAEKWLIAEYYDSLGHLSADGFDALTRQLKETCTFFPTVRECLDAIKPRDPYDYTHPFCKAPRMFQRSTEALALAGPVAALISTPDHNPEGSAA